MDRGQVAIAAAFVLLGAGFVVALINERGPVEVAAYPVAAVAIAGATVWSRRRDA